MRRDTFLGRGALVTLLRGSASPPPAPTSPPSPARAEEWARSTHALSSPGSAPGPEHPTTPGPTPLVLSLTSSGPVPSQLPLLRSPPPHVPPCLTGGCVAVPPPGRGQAPVLSPLPFPSSPLRNPIIRSDQHPVFGELPYLGCPPPGGDSALGLKPNPLQRGFIPSRLTPTPPPEATQFLL